YLIPAFLMMRSSREFINAHLIENMMREYQAPDIAAGMHPLMTTSGSGGFILTALRVLPLPPAEAAAVEAGDKRSKRGGRRGESRGDGGRQGSRRRAGPDGDGDGDGGRDGGEAGRKRARGTGAGDIGEDSMVVETALVKPGRRPFLIPDGSRAEQLRQHADRTLGAGNLRLAVKLPDGEDLNEWLAVHLVDFYNQIFFMDWSFTEFFTPTDCAVMS
ncbi:Mitotic exit network component, partial [Cladochytrium tenue]